MDLYHFDPATGEYRGTSVARESPLDPPGVYLIPANATNVAPPEAEEGKARVMVDAEWAQVPDHRGEIWWTEAGVEIVVDFLGDPAVAVGDRPALHPEPPPPPPPTADDVVAERARRLAAGFDYDFGDARGVHRIGTTASDMAGWDEVTKLASALLSLGDTSTGIPILTETGPAEVSAMEWQQILVASAAFRQPIWLASFAIQVMDPIPADFATNESYWP